MQYEAITNTVNWGVHQLCKNLNIPIKFTENTTLNESLEFLVGEVPPTSESFMQYIAIGKGGSKPYLSSGGSGATEGYEQSPLNSGLYQMVPFVVRAKDNDLTPAQRALYAGRTEKTIGGVDYWCYWLRRQDIGDNVINKTIYTTINGVKTETPFISKEENLKPTPIVVVQPTDEQGNMEALSDGKVVWVEKSISVTFNAFDIEEYRNAINILYGADEPAIIDELGLVTGGDRTRSFSDSTSGTYTFKDVVNAQISVYVSVYFNFTHSATNISYVFKIGIGEPLPIGTP